MREQAKGAAFCIAVVAAVILLMIAGGCSYKIKPQPRYPYFVEQVVEQKDKLIVWLKYGKHREDFVIRLEPGREEYYLHYEEKVYRIYYWRERDWRHPRRYKAYVELMGKIYEIPSYYN